MRASKRADVAACSDLQSFQRSSP